MNQIFCVWNILCYKLSHESFHREILFAELSLDEETEQELIVFMHKMWVVPVCSYMKRALELLIKL